MMTSLSVIKNPNHGIIEFNDPFNINYKATNNYSGTDALTVKLCGSGIGGDGCVNITYQITITEPSKQDVTAIDNRKTNSNNNNKSQTTVNIDSRNLSDDKICKKALDINDYNFDTNLDSKSYVNEAKRRGLSELDCRKLVLNKAEKINQQELINYDNLIKLLSDFASTNKPSTDPIKFAVAVDKLRKAVAGTDESARKDAYQQLKNLLDTDQNFIAFKKKKDEEARQADNEALRKLNSDANIIKAFIANYLNKNPIAEHAVDLGEIINSLDNEIKNQNLTSFKSTIETAHNKIQQFGLINNFEDVEIKNTKISSGVAVSPEVPTASKLLKITDNNKEILEGSKDDFIILYNATKDAEHVTTNLAGKLIFDNDIAEICWYQSKSSNDEYQRKIINEINKLGALKITNPKAVCEVDNISKFDLIIFERGIFLSGAIDYALPLNDKIEKGLFKIASIIKGEDILSEIQKNEILSQTIENEVNGNLRTGFGSIRIQNDSKVICVATNDLREGFLRLINNSQSWIFAQLGGRGSVLELSIEQAFISAKKNQCGIIYSSAPDMKNIYVALKRESIPYKTLPNWLTLKEVEIADAVIKTEKSEVEKVEKERRQKLADDVIASQTLKLTNNNKVLLEGSKDDIVILYNATKDAPNVATNLAGRLSFEKDQAYICWYQAKPSDDEHRRQALQELNKLGVLKVSDPKLSCDPSILSKLDIIILERGLFLSSTIDFALPLNDKVERGEFKLASLLMGGDILSEIQKHETLAQLVESEVEKDLRTGFGIVRIGNDNRVICAAISDHLDGHRKLLSGKTSEISDQLGGRGSILELSMEQAFISAKKNQCGIIYSSATDMKSLYPALKRESIPYKTLPIWFSLKEIDEADKAVKIEQTAALQSEEQTRQKLADEAKLKEASENTAEALRKKKENQLRSTYAVTSKALSEEVGKKILEDVSKITTNSQENQKPNYLSMFRELSSWYQKRINEQWELADSRFELYDYGTTRWNDRRIDTVFDKVIIKIKNRTIGKYDERCVVLGLVVDKEFEMYREPFEAPCDNVEISLDKWTKSREFEERWIVRK